MHPYCSHTFLALLLSVFVAADERFSEVDLWLPKAFQHHYIVLLNAAKKARAEPYCDELLSGHLIEQSSTIEHMQFNFRCRTIDKETFSIQVDGKTLAVNNQYTERKKKIEAEKKAEEARWQAETAKYWDVCFPVIKERLRLFEKPEILTSPIPPDPIIQGKKLTYLLDFNSQSQSRRTLHFVVRCEISGLDTYKVSVSGRKKAR